MPRSNAKELSFLCGAFIVLCIITILVDVIIIGIIIVFVITLQLGRWDSRFGTRDLGIQGSFFKLTIRLRRLRLHQLSSFVTRRRNTHPHAVLVTQVTAHVMPFSLFRGPFPEHVGLSQDSCPNKIPKMLAFSVLYRFCRLPTKSCALPTKLGSLSRSFARRRRRLRVSGNTSRAMSKTWP